MIIIEEIKVIKGLVKPFIENLELQNPRAFVPPEKQAFEASIIQKSLRELFVIKKSIEDQSEPGKCVTDEPETQDLQKMPTEAAEIYIKIEMQRLFKENYYFS